MSELLKKWAPTIGAIIYPKVRRDALGASDMGHLDYSSEDKVSREQLIELFEDELRRKD